MVHKPKEFTERIMPAYFNQTRYKSFQRQLNLYGFQRSKIGEFKGACEHRLMIKGMSNLTSRIVRARASRMTGRTKEKASNKANGFQSAFDDPGKHRLQVLSSRLPRRGSRQETVREPGMAIGLEGDPEEISQVISPSVGWSNMEELAYCGQTMLGSEIEPIQLPLFHEGTAVINNSEIDSGEYLTSPLPRMVLPRGEDSLLPDQKQLNSPWRHRRSISPDMADAIINMFGGELED